MCTGSPPPEDTDNQEAYAEMSEWMYNDWETRFQPIEQSLLDEVMNKDEHIAEQAEAAGDAAVASYNATLGMSERNMARYGTEMDADQQAATDRTTAMDAQGAEISAQNMARESAAARYQQLQADMVALGRGVQSTSLGGMQSAAGMEADRNASNQGAYGSHKASQYQAAGTAAAMGIAASEERRKKNIKPTSNKKALKDVESVALKKWDYKPGMSKGREEKGHIGGMAGDMPDSMTTEDKKGVELGDSVMTLVGATQELSDRIKKLEKGNVRS